MTRKKQIQKRLQKGQEKAMLFGHHVVCLIDVLGQKQKLAKWANPPADGKPTEEFVEAIKQTAGTVLGFRDQFLALFKQLETCTIPDEVAALPKAVQEAYWRSHNCSIFVERFSDSFVFSSLIGNAHGDITTAGLCRVLIVCCQAMLVSLAARISVRGAITVGAGAVLEDESFYGPALAEAHSLESEAANYPRIIVSTMVQEFISDGQRYSKDDGISDVMTGLAGLCRSLLCQDIDGWWTVDFLGKGVRDILGTDKDMTDVIEKAYSFVHSQALHFRSVCDTKLAVRYHLLQQYMESRFPLWGLKPGISEFETTSESLPKSPTAKESADDSRASGVS